MAREFFHASGILYIEEGIEKNSVAAHPKLGGNSVSFIVVCDRAKLINGLQRGRTATNLAALVERAKNEELESANSGRSRPENSSYPSGR